MHHFSKMERLRWCDAHSFALENLMIRRINRACTLVTQLTTVSWSRLGIVEADDGYEINESEIR